MSEIGKIFNNGPILTGKTGQCMVLFTLKHEIFTFMMKKCFVTFDNLSQIGFPFDLCTGISEFPEGTPCYREVSIADFHTMLKKS